jgi:hypothetical protein
MDELARSVLQAITFQATLRSRNWHGLSTAPRFEIGGHSSAASTSARSRLPDSNHHRGERGPSNFTRGSASRQHSHTCCHARGPKR